MGNFDFIYFLLWVTYHEIDAMLKLKLAIGNFEFICLFSLVLFLIIRFGPTFASKKPIAFEIVALIVSSPIIFFFIIWGMQEWCNVAKFLTFTPLVSGFLLMLYKRSSFVIATAISMFLFCFSLSKFAITTEYSNPTKCILYCTKIDTISSYMIILTTFVFFVSIIASKILKMKNLHMYLSILLILEGMVIGAFSVASFLYFYIWFELSLIPLFFIVGIWGGENRVRASIKLFLYTSFGSILLLTGILILTHNYNDNLSIIAVSMTEFAISGAADTIPLSTQILLFWMFLIGFMIKIPVFPFHSWLPDVHVQAPTTGSMLLAGIIIKIGLYGLFRIVIGCLPDVAEIFSNHVFLIGIFSMFYASFAAFKQNNIKKIVAYSSIAHMAVSLVGIFSFTEIGTKGAIFQLISHGLISPALFFIVGIIYSRTKTLDKNFGLAHSVPKISFFFMLLTMANIALPGTSAFVGEILVILGVSQVQKAVSFALAFGMVLSAIYMLSLYRSVFFGKASSVLTADLTAAELLLLTFFVTIILFLGFYPSFVEIRYDLYSA